MMVAPPTLSAAREKRGFAARSIVPSIEPSDWPT